MAATNEPDAPTATPANIHAYSRQNSRHVAIGDRVARREASNPISNHSGALATTASGYLLSSANGAPTTRRPGAATTPPTSPTRPLQRSSASRSDSHAAAPTTAGGTSATSQPKLRIRERYQRGPARSGD